MSQDKTAEKWRSRFEGCEQDQQALFSRVSKYYDILYAIQNTTNIAPWRSKIYIPILASKAWDLVSRLSGVLPYFQTKIDDIGWDEEKMDFVIPMDTRKRQMRLDAKLRKDYMESDEPMKLKVADTLLDAVVAGTGWAKASWETKDDVVYSKEIDDEGMVKNPDKDKETTEKDKGCNQFEPLNFFNVFPAKNSPSWAKLPYLIVRYYKPFFELEKNSNYNLSDLNDEPSPLTFNTNNNARNRVVNDRQISPGDSSVKTATVYECYERKKDGIYLTTYAEGKGGNGWKKIRPEGKRYWHKYYPVVPFYIRRKTFSPFGESLFENNATLQSATNDILNHYMDNLNVSLDSMIMYEDGTLTNDFVVEPGGEITYTGEVPKQFKFPEPNPAQLSQVINVLQGAIEQATVPQYISGVPDSSTDKTAGTAKGISLITEAATEKIGFMKDNFKQSMTIIGRINLSNLAQFQDRPERVEYTENGETKPDILLPQDYQGKIGLTIDDDSLLPLTKDEKRDITLQLIAQMGQIQKLAIEQATFFKDPTSVPKFKYGEAFEEVAQYFSVKDSIRFMDKAEAPQRSVETDGGEGAIAEQLLGGGGGQDPAMAAIQGQQGGAMGGMANMGVSPDGQ